MTLAALREQRTLIHENMMWRKQHIESARAVQVRIEREAILSKIDNMAPGLRVIYLKQRLAKLKMRFE